MIKATTNKKKEDEIIDVPRLMMFPTGEIILVLSVNGNDAVGICAYDPNKIYKVGYYGKKLNVRILSDYTGEITLKNELI